MKKCHKCGDRINGEVFHRTGQCQYDLCVYCAIVWDIRARNRVGENLLNSLSAVKSLTLPEVLVPVA